VILHISTIPFFGKQFHKQNIFFLIKLSAFLLQIRKFASNVFFIEINNSILNIKPC